MLLPLRYKPGVCVYSTMQILGYLAQLGHRVTWVISSEKDCDVKEPIIAGVSLCVVPYPSGFPRKSPLVNIVIQIFHSLKRISHILRLFREEEFDLVLVRDTPLTVIDALVAAYIIRRRYRIPFVYEIPNPLEQRWQYARIRREYIYCLLAMISAYISKHLMYRADLIMPVSYTLTEHLVKLGVSETKIVTLPEGVDTRIFSGQNGKWAKDKFQLNNCHVIIYVGVMDKVRNLEVLIHAFHHLRLQTLNVKLLMVGDGDGIESLKQLAQKLGIREGIVFTGHVPQLQVPDYIAAADIGISPVPPLPFYRFSSPIKLFEYMAMAKPVIANNEIPEHQEVLKESGGGILVSFSPEAFADAIVELINDPIKANAMGVRGRVWVAENRSYEVLARQVEVHLFELLNI